MLCQASPVALLRRRGGISDLDMQPWTTNTYSQGGSGAGLMWVWVPGKSFFLLFEPREGEEFSSLAVP